MRRKGLLSLAVVSLALAGCGGGDDGDDTSGQEEAARQAVTDLIAAYQAEDFEAVCELQDERVNEAIPKATKAETCPEGYEELFSRQKAFAGGDDEAPFDAFVEQLGDYEVGEATLTEQDGVLSGQVLLDGPEDAASLVVEEAGEMKVSELFVTPDANSAPESSLGG